MPKYSQYFSEKEFSWTGSLAQYPKLFYSQKLQKKQRGSYNVNSIYIGSIDNKLSKENVQ